MGIDALTLADIFAEIGHVYVTNKDYVHMHFYTGDGTIADRLATTLNARIVPHMQVFDVVISKRAVLATACRKIMRDPLPEEQKQLLTLVLRYCEAAPNDRQSIVLELRKRPNR